MIAAPVIAAVTYKYRRKPLGRAGSGVAGVRFFISRNKDTQNGSLNATIEIHIAVVAAPSTNTIPKAW